jgi:ABC-2 type transport system permease protein
VISPLRIFWMVRKEFLQVFRDPRMARVLLVAPIIQLMVFGYAVSTDLRHAALHVVDLDNSAESRALVEAFEAGGLFRVAGRSTRPAEQNAALYAGEALAALTIPAGFARDLDAGRAEVQLLFDGSSSNQATLAKGYAEQIVQSFAARHTPGGAPPLVFDPRIRAWFNENLESRNYNVPAVLGAILLLICQLLTALAIIREREMGNLEQLLVSPLRPLELILGKTIPFALIGLFDLGLISAVAILHFGVPFRGSALLLIFAAILFLVCALGIGLLISTLSKTQQEAFLSSFLVFMPAMLLSGFMFPVSSMPKIFQLLTLVNPLRHFLEIVRGLFLKGVGFADVLPQLGALALIGTLLLSLAAARFSRRG